MHGISLEKKKIVKRLVSREEEEVPWGMRERLTGHFVTSEFRPSMFFTYLEKSKAVPL